ncbi:MAG: hypothetical protein AAF990_24140 [Bacteroidota bacterium]
MKNFKILITFILLLVLNTSYAQLEKGNLLIGGSVALDMQLVEDGDNLLVVFVNPSILTLITNNFAVGGVVGLTYRKRGEASATSLSVLPSGRLYFPGLIDNVAFFVDAQIGLQLESFGFDGFSNTESAFAFGFGPGMAFFISDNISIDTGLSFYQAGDDVDQSSTFLSSIHFNIGLQVFLTRKKKE